MTGCQLLNQLKIAATVKGLEEALAREIELSRQGVTAQLLGASELEKQLQQPAAMVNAIRNLAQICGYYRPEASACVASDDGDAQRVLQQLQEMPDETLLQMITAGS